MLHLLIEYPKMHAHTEFGIPTSKKIGDIRQTQSGKDGRTDSVITLCPTKFLWVKNISADDKNYEKLHSMPTS